MSQAVVDITWLVRLLETHDFILSQAVVEPYGLVTNPSTCKVIFVDWFILMAYLLITML